MKTFSGLIFLVCLLINPLNAFQFGTGHSPIDDTGTHYESPVEDFLPSDTNQTQPSILKIYDEEDNIVTLSWEAYPNAEYYEVDVLDVAGWNLYHSGAETKLVLAMSVIYSQFRVRSCAGATCSDYLEISAEEANRIVSNRCTTEPYCEVIGLEHPVYPM